MKRFTATWILCSVFSLCAFAVLVVEDRQLGVPLPYSVPIAFAVVLAVPITPLLCSRRLRRTWKKLLAAPPVRVQSRPPAPPVVARHRAAEGVVLLDFSNARRIRRDAA